MKLSIIIPAYNEEHRLGDTLTLIWSFMREEKFDYEVIVVDDGSDDATCGVAEGSSIFKDEKLSIIKNDTNRGKGFSVKRGILSSKGEYVLFTDADMSSSIKQVKGLFMAIEEGYDIAIGSRSIGKSRVEVHQPWLREKMGKVFNLLVNVFVIKGFRDTQCGFKLFKGDMVREIAGDISIEGFAFDVELLYLAYLKGCKIKEVGVSWRHVPESKVKIVGSSGRMFLDILRIKKLHKSR